MSSRKSRLCKHLIRYCLVLLGTAAAVGCDVIEPDPGSISLSIAKTSATVVQGGTQEVIATLTRYGGFSGAVDLTVAGAPSGVTAAISNMQTTGAVTTATVTILVGAAVAPGSYPLVVRGTGSGVTEVRQMFSLTVAPPPSILLSLSTGGASVWQGNSMSLLANLVRAGGFSGSVDVTVSGAPSGVTATVYGGPTSGAVTTAYVFIHVDAATVLGVYSLVVHATGSGISEATAAFTLTTTVPGFSLTLSSPTLSIVKGAASQIAMVNVVRAHTTGAVTFEVSSDADEDGGLPPGVTATLAPNPTAGNGSVLVVAVSAAAVPGVYNLYILGQTQGGSANGGGYAFATLTLTIAADPTQAIEQWATSATASSQWGDESGAARQATGAPDVGVGVCGEDDVHHAWSSLTAGNGEWLELSYPTPVQPTMIRVYENWSPGSIVKVEVKDAAGQYTAVYTAQVTTPGCPHTLEIPVTGVMARISAVRISVDQLAHQDWNEIDAVQLVGRP